jgi:transcriptional regulator with XRE-family HTH domain
VSKSRKYPDCKAFGANVRRERMALEMTQERLAELVDLNIRTVQKIEAGEINILLTTLVRFFRVLNCPWGRLMPVKDRAGGTSS